MHQSNKAWFSPYAISVGQSLLLLTSWKLVHLSPRKGLVHLTSGMFLRGKVCIIFPKMRFFLLVSVLRAF